MKAKRFFSVLLILILIAVSFGCLSPSNVDDFGYVLALGIDKGKQFKYNLSFMMQGATLDATDTSTSEPTIVSAEGDSIFDAIYICESALPYQLNFARTNLVVVSEELSKTDLLVEFLHVSFSSIQLKSSANLLVCAGEVTTFLEGLKSNESVDIAKLESDLITLYRSEGGTTVISISEFLSSAKDSRFDAAVPFGGVDESIDTGDDSKGKKASEDNQQEKDKQKKEEKKDTTAGVFREGGMKSFCHGAAIFSRGRMVGVIDHSETKLLLMAQGKLEGAIFTLVNPDGSSYILRLSNSKKSTVKYDIDSETAAFEIFLRAYFLESTKELSPTEIHNEGDGINATVEMEEKVSNLLRDGLSDLFSSCVKLNSDVFGIGRFAGMKFFSTKDWIKYDFAKKIPYLKAEFTVTVEVENMYASSYLE